MKQETVTKGDKGVTQPTLEYQTGTHRIKARYDIELARFKLTNPLPLTRGEFNKIGTHDRRIEHMTLTSTETLIRDALTFLFARTRETPRLRQRKWTKNKEKEVEEG
jgi:hypothetical protein